MKDIFRGAIAALVLCFTTAQAEDTAKIKETVKGKVEQFNGALLKEDFDKVVDLTHPNAVKLIGGRKKMIATMESGTKEMKAQGYTIRSVKVDDALEPVAAGTELFVVVPYQIEMKAPGGKVFQKSFVIGVSDDQGKSWSFVDGNPDIKKIKQVLPNLPAELKYPDKKKPVFEKD